MSDRPSGIDLATEECFYNLVEISPDAEELLEKMRDGLWARTLFASKTTRLSDEEKRTAEVASAGAGFPNADALR